MSVTEQFFQPRGIYKVHYYVQGKEYDKDATKEATGELVNYHNGDIVLENRKTKEVTILKYRHIVQMYKIGDVDTYDDSLVLQDEDYEKVNQAYIKAGVI